MNDTLFLIAGILFIIGACLLIVSSVLQIIMILRPKPKIKFKRSEWGLQKSISDFNITIDHSWESAISNAKKDFKLAEEELNKINKDSGAKDDK